MGQERYLRALSFTWKAYQAYSGNWEHEHCKFCWAKFVDPNYAAWMKEKIDAGARDHLAAGYTNLRDGDTASGTYWVCEQCFADFLPEFGWTLIESDAEAWPYDTPEPNPRPTSADYRPDAGRGAGRLLL
jgi:hypothetical protein